MKKIIFCYLEETYLSFLKNYYVPPNYKILCIWLLTHKYSYSINLLVCSENTN